MRKPSKVAAVIAGGALAVATAGTAYAYWSTSGSGTGTASTSAGQAAAFTVAGDVAKAMFPGDRPQTGTATVTNAGTENARLAKLAAYLTTDKAGCTGADYMLNGEAAPSSAEGAADLGVTAVDLAPGATASKTFTLQFNNLPRDQDACKGAAVTIHYVAS